MSVFVQVDRQTGLYVVAHETLEEAVLSCKEDEIDWLKDAENFRYKLEPGEIFEILELEIDISEFSSRALRREPHKKYDSDGIEVIENDLGQDR